LGSGHPFQDILKIFPGINLLLFAAGQQGVKKGEAFSSFIGTGEQEMFATQRHWTEIPGHFQMGLF